jgi:hypothetical protein
VTIVKLFGGGSSPAAAPDEVKQFHYEKGLLFIGLKVINEAGRELHADNVTDAAKYNLAIMYGNTSKKKEETAST